MKKYLFQKLYLRNFFILILKENYYIILSRFVLRSLSESPEEEEDASEPKLLLDMIGGFDVGFTATRRVTGGPRPSRLRKDYNLKLLNYSGLAPAD